MLLSKYISSLRKVIHLPWCNLSGFRVFATARKIEAMSDFDIPGITRLQLDVTNIESIRETREKVKEVLGSDAGLDMLVNNAGIRSTTPALDHELPDIRLVFETNVFELMAMAQEFVALVMLSLGACIVNAVTRRHRYQRWERCRGYALHVW
jgi:1-acylglycerone phosphate reductase